MKKLSIAFLSLALIFSGCKRAGDVLATYQGGQITRGEFYAWMDFRNMAKEAILKNKSQQKSQLEQFTAEKLTVQEAKKAGFDKSDDFKYLNNFFRQNFYAQYLSKIASTKGEFKEKVARVRIIKFLVKNYKIENNRRQEIAGNELESAFNEKMDKAQSVISELEKGGSFEELAKKYSDDPTKMSGGDIGFIIEGSRSEIFTKAVFALKKGEFTKKPVRDGNAVYIIKVDNIDTLTENNIEDIIVDKGQQMSLKRRLMYNSSLKLQETLIKAKDVENNVETVNFNTPAAIVYKMEDKEFRVADLNKFIVFISKRKMRMGIQDKGMNDADKRKMAKDILQRDVLMREVVRRGIDKEEKFKKELQFTLDYYLSGIYQTEVIIGQIKVAPGEIKTYYNKNLEKMYTRNVQEGGKNVNKPIPFETVKISIEHRLINIKRSEKMKAWTDVLLGKNNFKIIDAQLEGK